MVKNYLYNLMYQIITILIPIITIPYISRVLGADGLGIYALSSTYAQYFVLFGMLGLSMYCSREIAYVKNDEKELNKVFWELNFLRFILMGISLIIYFFIFLNISPENRSLNIIQSLILFTALFDISWLFIGLENFKKVSIRNAIFKILGVTLVFILVKNHNQVELYALILGIVQLLGQLIMWIDLPKEIKFIVPKYKEMIRHLKFSFKLFIPQIAMNVYTTLDKVMLGWIINETEVGMYENSQKIIKVAITIVTALAAVTIPKMANLHKENRKEEFCNNVYKSFSFVSFLAFPMTLGLIGVSRTFTQWFYGPGFKGIDKMFFCGSWLMITLAWSSIVGTQVLVSMKRDKQFTIAVTTGAVINVIFNFILIKSLKGVGTTIASVMAEFTGMFIMVYFVRDIVSIKTLFKDVPKYFIISLIMFIPVFFIGEILNATIFTTMLQFVIGFTIYIGIMFFVKDYNLMYIINFINNKLKKEIGTVAS